MTAPLTADRPWGALVAAYFVLLGVPAGLGLVSWWLRRAGGPGGRLGRYADRVSAAALVVISVLLVVDLGRPDRFFLMLTRFDNLGSPIAVGAKLIAVEFALLVVAVWAVERHRRLTAAAPSVDPDVADAPMVRPSVVPAPRDRDGASAAPGSGGTPTGAALATTAGVATSTGVATSARVVTAADAVGARPVADSAGARPIADSAEARPVADSAGLRPVGGSTVGAALEPVVRGGLLATSFALALYPAAVLSRTWSAPLAGTSGGALLFLLTALLLGASVVGVLAAAAPARLGLAGLLPPVRRLLLVLLGAYAVALAFEALSLLGDPRRAGSVDDLTTGVDAVSWWVAVVAVGLVAPAAALLADGRRAVVGGAAVAVAVGACAARLLLFYVGG
ncbi:NrfD/PsrC family molybdoenzyme membrane anchor subunit [Micromonospora sp. NPDC050495]|uniref:NrfD/PsrC family molybdoenzyme membrane anchor subunit n=1 Tax=Micromonospora sp. NPDC050495 TaxID=3154936 RepID=UPI0033D05D4F